MDHCQDKSSDFGPRLKSIRDSAGLQQGEIANILGVSKQTVWRWESGQNEPTYSQLHVIARICDVSIQWLMTGEGEQERRDKPSEAELNETIAWQANRLRSLEETLKAVTAELETLKTDPLQAAIDYEPDAEEKAQMARIAAMADTMNRDAKKKRRKKAG